MHEGLTLDLRVASSADTTGSLAVGADDAWNFLLALRRSVDAGAASARFDRIVGAPGHPAARLSIDLADGKVIAGAELLAPAAAELIELFAGLAARPAATGWVVALLGQSLDGYIATHSGDSRCVSGRESLVHQHRLRAMSDAVLVGASTAVLDDPRLTTRHVPGPHPVRVVIDPNGRLPRGHGLLCDELAETLVIRTGERAGERTVTDQATELTLTVPEGRLCPREVVAALRQRGLGRVMVEGGGVTVTRFLEAGVLERLQLAVAPILLGAGRRSIELPGVARLSDALRPRSRHYLMGDDVLFDLAF